MNKLINVKMDLCKKLKIIQLGTITKVLDEI